jgi:hypothetical protein
MAPRASAYSLRETERGWQWHVIDSDGNTIDAGVAPDKIAARASISRIRGLGSSPALASSPRSWRALIQALVGRAR